LTLALEEVKALFEQFLSDQLCAFLELLADLCGQFGFSTLHSFKFFLQVAQLFIILCPGWQLLV
jgi:hypothetical protein